MLARLALITLGFAATAQAALTILSPSSHTIWYKNSTVNLDWTVSAPETDTYFFRTYISNKDSSVLSGSQCIADSTNATAGFVRILLPQLASAQQYVVTLVNTTDESQVFATSEEFEIADGEVTTSTASTASQTASSTKAAEIPNAGKTTTSSSDPFATAATSSGPTSAATKVDTGLAGVALHAAIAVVAAGVGMGVAP
ncbi:hypothetical protein IAT38_001090 [Cryptococcus sp. DSM 104549]